MAVDVKQLVTGATALPVLYTEYIFRNTSALGTLTLQPHPALCLLPHPSISAPVSTVCSQQHHRPERYNMQTQLDVSSYYSVSV